MKKNNFSLFNLKYITLFCSACFLFLTTSCDFDNVSGPEPKPDPDPEPPADTLGTVAPDGILETVTWNLEWYGSFGNGPSDEDLQTKNALKVIDSLKADLYALQEITDQTALKNLTSHMKGYRGFVADHIDYNQKTAFIFNTQTIDSVSSGAITQSQDENSWAGRLPLYFSFNYTYKNRTIPVYAIVIHAKCCADQESYLRRKRAAESLHTYLMRNKPEDANIIFLGDYNDDVDESIYQGNETPYISFVQDNDDFLVITKSLSEQGQSTTVNYPDAVDHITISNEMEAFYTVDSEKAFEPGSFIEDYGATTSDHYPVIAKFNIQ